MDPLRDRRLQHSMPRGYGSFRSAVLAFEPQIRTAHGGEKIRCWADVKYSPGPVLIESPQCQPALVMLHEYLSSKDFQIELLSYFLQSGLIHLIMSILMFAAAIGRRWQKSDSHGRCCMYTYIHTHLSTYMHPHVHKLCAYQ